MHNALTDNYFVVSLVYSFCFFLQFGTTISSHTIIYTVRLWEGVGEGLTKHRMHTCPFGAP